MKVNRTQRPENERHAQGKTNVADPGDDERLLARVGSGLPGEVEADQQIGAQPHAFPAHEHERIISRADQGQHHEQEEVQVSKETVIAAFALHVSTRVEMDQEGDNCNGRGHHQGQAVVIKGEVGAEIARLNPGEVGVLEKTRFMPRMRERPGAEQGENHGEAGRAAADHGHRRLGEAPSKDAVERGAGERREQHQQEQGLHRAMNAQ